MAVRLSSPAKAVLVATLLLTMSSPAVALAHGPAPSPLRVLHADGDQLVISTNIGVATSTTCEVYDYVCPGLWGGLETPLAAAVSRETWVTTGCERRIDPSCRPRLYSTSDRGCTFEPIADYDDVTIRALVAHEDAVYGATGGEVFRWRAGQVDTIIDEGQSVRFDSLAAGRDTLWAAAARPTMSLAVFSPDGEGSLPIVNPAPPTTIEVQRLSVRWVDGPQTAWFVATTDDGLELWRTDDGGESLQQLLVVNDPDDPLERAAIFGPVELCDGIVLVTNEQEIWTDPDFPPSCDVSALTDDGVTCLRAEQDLRYACALGTLRTLDDSGEALVATQQFAIDDLRGPATDCDRSEPDIVQCESDWLHFGGESGLVGGPASNIVCDDEVVEDVGVDAGPDVAEPTITPSGGDGGGCDCQTTTTQPDLVGCLVLLGLLLVCRRR